MAIYGLNFNSTPIPDGIQRKFAKRIKLGKDNKGKWVWADLRGVGQSRDELSAMLMQANNGSRKLVWTRRWSASEAWYGVYTHYTEPITDLATGVHRG